MSALPAPAPRCSGKTREILNIGGTRGERRVGEEVERESDDTRIPAADQSPEIWAGAEAVEPDSARVDFYGVLEALIARQPADETCNCRGVAVRARLNS